MESSGVFFSDHFLQVFALLIHELLKRDLGSLPAMRIPGDLAGKDPKLVSFIIKTSKPFLTSLSLSGL